MIAAARHALAGRQRVLIDRLGGDGEPPGGEHVPKHRTAFAGIAWPRFRPSGAGARAAAARASSATPTFIAWSSRMSIATLSTPRLKNGTTRRLPPSPLIIGGGKRGVVSTACYIARISGVRSAMPMFKALQLCPEAVVIRPNMEKYARVGREIRRRMLELTPLVEPLSIDEAFLDLSGTEKLHRASPALVLARFARDVEREVGITVSVGLAANKFLAKIASDLDKPRGFSVIGQSEAAAFLAPRPVTAIWGVGRAFSERLAADGFRTVGDLQAADPARLASRYGRRSVSVSSSCRVARTAGTSFPTRSARASGSEVTFFEDLADLRDLRPILREQAERVSFGLKHEDIAGSTVTPEAQDGRFQAENPGATPCRTPPSSPTASSRRPTRSSPKRRMARNTGSSASRSRISAKAALPIRPISSDQKATRKAAAERAMDVVRQKFGKHALETGLVFGNHRRHKE